MRMRTIFGSIMLAVTTLLIAGACKDMGDSQSVTQPPPPPPGGTLNATPNPVSVSSGQTVTVTISGGTLPYVIATPPNAVYASAVLPNPAVEPAILSITGVSNASIAGSTFVKIKDSSPSPEKEVQINITKTP